MAVAAHLTRVKLEAAARLVQEHIGSTPQFCWPLLCDAVGAEVWVKHENLTPTGAFKVRGGVVYMHDQFGAIEKRDGQRSAAVGLITATRGNHGQSLPFAARAYSVPVTVVVPRGNSPDKNRAMVAWGAEVIEQGDDFDEAREAAAQLATESKLTFVPSFHPLLVQGVASWALELFAAVDDLDELYVPIGMGSGLCGAMAARDALGVKTKIFGVVSDQADAMALSLEQGKLVQTPSARTFADGIATRVPNAEAFAAIQAGAAGIVRVTDGQIAAAMGLLFRTTHHVAEGAGAASLAAACTRRRASAAKIGVVVSGGNVDADVFSEVLQGRTPNP